MANPHQMVLDLLQSGKAEWCQSSLGPEWTLRRDQKSPRGWSWFKPTVSQGKEYCAMGLYRQACLQDKRKFHFQPSDDWQDDWNPGVPVFGHMARLNINSEEHIVRLLDERFGQQAMNQILIILLEQFGNLIWKDQGAKARMNEIIQEAKDGTLDRDLVSELILNLNDAVGFSRESFETALEKAALAWEEQV